MHRIDSDNREVDKHGSGKDGFTEGDPTAGIPSTEVSADILDTFQEEVAGVVEGADLTLEKTDNGQLLTAIRTLIGEYQLANFGVMGSASASENITAIAFDPSIDCWVVLQTNSKAAYSLNGGYSWVAQSNIPAAGAVAYAVASNGAGLLVAVGTSGGIWTSTNGTSWTARTAAGSYTGTFRGVCWDANNSLWVAVGDSAEIQTSTDGTTWTARAAGSSYADHFQSVASDGNSRIVAVGAGGEIQTSDNGTSWVRRTTGSGYSDTFRAVAYGNGMWVAVGDAPVTMRAVIQTSPDGATWTQNSFPYSYADHYRALVWTGTHFLVLGDVSDDEALARSPDGKTWTPIATSFGLNSSYNSIEVGNGAVFLGYFDDIYGTPRLPG